MKSQIQKQSKGEYIMERQVKVQFVLITSIGKFANAASRCACSIDVKSERQIVDGKSIVGLYALNLSEPVTVVIRAAEDNEKNNKSADDFLEAIKDIIIEE